ncbi:M20/M25/M40 family metallo-hydrolase [Novosphingobium colocasiae]|uniref:M20/M25/M40 family metallo-hydrolase n=1 Tax=Novosphingobium colocasiae TaxID=1256513 RepID=UPI0035AE7672
MLVKTRLIPALMLLSPLPAYAADEPTTPAGREALDILKEAVAVPTVIGRGQVPVLAEKLRARLIAGGFAADDVRFVPVGETGYLTARYPGRDRKAKPLVVIGHMDVVEANPADWERDPFTPIVEGGYIFGRGTNDMKGDLAMIVAAAIDLKRKGWVPAHDVVLAFSGDEETAMATTKAMAQALSGAGLVLNGDAGGGELGKDGKAYVYSIQAGEKTYADYTLTLTDPGGHSSRPGATNPIAAMGTALAKVWANRFAPQVSPLTKAYLEGTAPRAPADLAGAMRAFAANPGDAAAVETLSASPAYVGVIRTTCVPTQITGGHAPNALPQRVTANVNCRIFPGTSRQDIEAQLRKIIADPQITIAFRDNGTLESRESPLDKRVLAAVTKAVRARVPGLAIVPSMSAGATDSMHFRALGIPSYGVSATFMDPDDDFSHGLNERLPLATIDPGVAQWEALLQAMAK